MYRQEWSARVSGRGATMVLLRHLLGDVLRRLRLRQGRTLREVSGAARVSLGYLSEVERGQKEASSELLAAICAALGVPLSRVLREVSDGFALAELQNVPVLVPPEPALAGRPGREMVASQAIGSARQAVLEGPVGARDILASRPLHHEMIGGDAARPAAGAFGDGTNEIGDIKDMIPV
jgi:XRE family transcriptional regulator, stress-response regulator